VLELYAHGSIVCRRVEGPDARADARLLTALYRQTQGLNAELPGFGPHHYTREGVTDHTDLDTFTIDPASTVDYDDALSVGADGIVYIHIVDIMTAMHRIDLPRVRCLGSSLYLANEHTEHLLDTETMEAITLAEGLIRTVITVAVTLDPEGSVAHYEVYRSTIRVKRRFTYEEAATLLDEHPGLATLDRLATLRSSAISYKIDMPSVRLEMNGVGEPIEVRLESTTDAVHTLVSTAMILCNLVISYHLKARGIDLPNRFHAAIRGVPVGERGDLDDLTATFCLLKKMARAEYSVDRRGHFGLGLTDYVHFTSPMRRYADIVTHMILAGAAFTRADLEVEVAALNRRATFVRSLQRFYTRTKVDRWLYARGSEGHEVVVTSVAAAGVQWFMPSVLLNGFCHVSMLRPARRWNFNPETGSLYADLWRIRVGDQLIGSVAGPGQITLTVTLTVRSIEGLRAPALLRSTPVSH
jgi:exoribonuclease-2